MEKFSELPAATWYVLGLMVVLGVALIVMSVKKAPKPAIVAVSALLLAALVAACYLTIPTVTADLESGGVTTASWLYSPAFWSVIVCLVGLALAGSPAAQNPVDRQNAGLRRAVHCP